MHELRRTRVSRGYLQPLQPPSPVKMPGVHHGGVGDTGSRSTVGPDRWAFPPRWRGGLRPVHHGGVGDFGLSTTVAWGTRGRARPWDPTAGLVHHGGVGDTGSRSTVGPDRWAFPPRWRGGLRPVHHGGVGDFGLSTTVAWGTRGRARPWDPTTGLVHHGGVGDTGARSTLTPDNWACPPRWRGGHGVTLDLDARQLGLSTPLPGNSSEWLRDIASLSGKGGVIS